MSTTVKTGWLNDKNGDKFAPKTLTSQVQTSDGTLFEDKLQTDLDTILATAQAYTDTKTAELASTTEITNSISAHNTSADAHNDIRELITELATKLNIWYGTCTTASATAAKVVTTITGDFTLKEGATVYVLFNTDNTSTSRITLNVDGTGNITVNLNSTNGMTAYQIAAKQVICFVYDGESFRVQGGSLATTTYYGLTKLSSSTSSTATNMAATPSAVKEAYDLANAAVPVSGGTMTGILTAQNNTSYTTKQVRNIILVAEGNSLPSGSNGDICLVYTP